MSRYFFNVRGGALIPDLEGTELGSAECARAEALDCAREILADGLRAEQNRQGWSVEVVDEAGQTVFVLPFAVAFDTPAALSRAA